MNVCPCCGAPVNPSKLLVDLDANIVVLNGKMERIAPQIAEIIASLNKKYPGSARFDELANALFGPLGPDDTRNLVYQLVYRARIIGRKLGFKIETNTTRGYRLIINESPIS